MNRGFGIVLAVPIFFCATFSIMLLQYIDKETESWEEYVINYAIDYATDAAAEEMLEGVHIGTDYQQWGRVNSEPDTALKTFETIMLLTYDFPLTEKAYTQLDSGYVPIFCVAAYDGYYPYTLVKQPSSHGQYNMYLQGMQKLPYRLLKNGNYYALNLGYTDCRKLSNGKLTLAPLADEGITETDVREAVSKQITEDLTYRWQEYAVSVGREDVNIDFFPSSRTTVTVGNRRQVNAIEGPSVIAMIDGWDLNTTHNISAFTIGGSKLQVSRMVAGYVDSDGKKWYSYADLLPADFTTTHEIKDMFTSMTAAAEKGYYYDPFYMD